MRNESLIREIANRACREALQEKSQELAEDVSRRMAIAFASQSPQPERTKELRDGAVLIAGSRTQTEALEALLAASSAITPACGLMILRGAQAIGWNCHSLTTLDNFKRTTLDCSGGVAGTVISSCVGMAAQGAELDPLFTARLGLDNASEILLVPVLLKERVAALLVAPSQHFDDLAGLELLVQVAQLTLDLQAYRKSSPRPNGEQTRHVEAHRPPSEPSRPTPEAQGHKLAYGAAAASRFTIDAPKITAPDLQQERASATTSKTPSAVIARPYPAPAASASHLSVTMPQSTAHVSDEVHEKARRFAKLLVEEIKLYNQTKVAEGRARGDLYSRLREDIEKSRAAYHKRYGERVRDVDYFSQELIRILTDNDPTVMGAGFSG